MGEKRPTEIGNVSQTMSTFSSKAMKTSESNDENDGEPEVRNVLAQFCSESGEVAGPPIELPVSLPRDKLQLILHTFLKEEEPTPYSFFIDDQEVKTDLKSSLNKIFVSEEKILKILYQPQAVFRVRAVTRCTSSLSGHSEVVLHTSFSPDRCTSSLSGHSEAVLHTSFSPDGRFLASGSGDCSVRFWDINTETPHFTAKGHTHWVLVTSWSPDGEKLASACKSGIIMVWDPSSGKQIGKSMRGHKQWVNALAWEPLHKAEDGVIVRLASAGKDGDVRIWDTRLGTCKMVLTCHTKSVTALRWGGEGLIYSGSQDRNIHVWNSQDGSLCWTLSGHAHWVNTLALNTDYVIRTGATDPRKLMKAAPEYTKKEERLSTSLKRYQDTLAVCGAERLVSGSDDFTLFLWEPSKQKTPVARLTGHQQLVNDVKFSPDARLVASASFDKSIRLWDGVTGKFVGTLHGHVAGVYQVSWSADSRLLVSGSKDSTLKVWNISKKKMELDLPGHADEVYAVDWSPDGERVVSGGKDKILKIWRR